MTVRELIELLGSHDPNALIVLSKDAEGNSFSPLEAVERGYYEAESTYSGEFAGWDHKEELPDTAVATVCLWPVN